MPDGQTSVRLVNLTQHPILLDRIAGGRLTVAPDGRQALVEEPTMHARALAITNGSVQLRTIMRSERVAGLPAPESGVLYIVPRLTALASARTDLVFPLDEWRDGASVMVGAGALGTLHVSGRSIRRRSDSWRRWRAWASGASNQRLESAAAGALATGTALSGAALGIVPNLATGGLPGPTGQLITFAVFTVAGAAGIGLGTYWLRARLARRRRHGTAYLVEEVAGNWTQDEKAAFLDDLDERFADVLRVPGPSFRGARWQCPDGRLLRWQWQNDPDAARRWSAHLDDLVRAFWITHFHDDETTGNAVFIWASWPVAMGFGARASAGRRWSGLRVGQRPSRGRAGPIETPAATTWDFRRDGAGAVLAAERPGERTFDKVVIDRVEDAGTGGVTSPDTLSGTADGTVLILVVRLNAAPWGALPAVPAQPAVAAQPDVTQPAVARSAVAQPLTVRVRDAAGRLPAGAVSAVVEEFTYLGAGGRLAWSDFPAVVVAVADWITRQCAAAAPGTTVLLGMNAPSEIAVGIGVHAADHPESWPTHLRPLVWADGLFLLPDLDLGSAPLRDQHWD